MARHTPQHNAEVWNGGWEIASGEFSGALCWSGHHPLKTMAERFAIWLGDWEAFSVLLFCSHSSDSPHPHLHPVENLGNTLNTLNPFLCALMTSVQVLENFKMAMKIYFSGHESSQVKSQSGVFGRQLLTRFDGNFDVGCHFARASLAYPSILGGLWGCQVVDSLPPEHLELR